jgi:hypothetical protein
MQVSGRGLPRSVEDAQVSGRRGPYLPTVIAVAVVAYAAADVIHEAGHGLVCVLSGYDIISISTVATQSTGDSRPLAAAGSIANLIAGAIAWLLFRKTQRFNATQYFLWLYRSSAGIGLDPETGQERAGLAWRR